MIEIDGRPILTDIGDALNALDQEPVIAFDVETDALHPIKANIALLQFHGRETGASALLHIRGDWDERLTHFLGRADKKFIVHNAVGYELPCLEKYGVDWETPTWWDTMVAEMVLKTSDRRDIRINLGASVKRRLGMEIDKDIDHSIWMNETLTPEQLSYALNDVLYLHDLMDEQIAITAKARSEEAMQLEQDIVPIVARMKTNGVPFNMERWEHYWEDAIPSRERAEAELQKLAPEVKNWNSPAQVKQAFLNRKYRVHNTRKETLMMLVLNDSPAAKLAQLVLDYRAPAQFMKTYNPEWVAENVIKGRVHGSFWQCSADTTRFTASNPNLQQVPKLKRDMIGYADDFGLRILQKDYSQIEVRIAATVSGDEGMVHAVAQEDVHTEFAAAAFAVARESVEKWQRKAAKALVFTLLFGGGVNAFVANANLYGANLTKDQGYKIMDNFFERFPGVDRMKSAAYRRAKIGGPVVLKLPLGYRRILNGKKKSPTVIMNTMVQGPAAIGIKLAMREIGQAGLHKHLSSVIHDELVWSDVPVDEVEKLDRAADECMRHGMKRVCSTTVVVDSDSGLEWKP